MQAGSYILRSGNLSSYLELYNKHRLKLLKEHGRQRLDNYELTVSTTWQISVDKLSSEATMFLRVCGFMHYDGISEEKFEHQLHCCTITIKNRGWERCCRLGGFLLGEALSSPLALQPAPRTCTNCWGCSPKSLATIYSMITSYG